MNEELKEKLESLISRWHAKAAELEFVMFPSDHPTLDDYKAGIFRQCAAELSAATRSKKPTALRKS